MDKVELLKAVAHPARIKILEELSKGVKCVSDFSEFLGINQPNVSQHLTALRNRGIIDYYVDGRLRCYFLVDAFIPDLLEILGKKYDSEKTEKENLTSNRYEILWDCGNLGFRKLYK